MAGLVFRVVEGHDRLVVDPELDVGSHGSDAIAKPFSVFGEQFGSFAGWLAWFPEPSRVAVAMITDLGFVAAREIIRVVRWRVSSEIEAAVGRGSFAGDAEHALGLEVGTRGVRIDVPHAANAHQDA